MLGEGVGMASGNRVVIHGDSSHMTLDSFIESAGINSQNLQHMHQTVPVFQGDAIYNGHAEIPLSTPTRFFESDLMTTMYTQLVSNASREASFGISHPIDDSERFMRSFSPANLPNNLLATASRRSDNLNNVALSAPSVLPPEITEPYVSNERYTPNPPDSNSLDCGCGKPQNSMDTEMDFERNQLCPYLTGNASNGAEFQVPNFVGGLNTAGWDSINGNMSIDNSYGSSRFSNDLSLGLASCQAAIICRPRIADQCSEMSCSGASSFKETRFSREQVCLKNKGHSLSSESCRLAQHSQDLCRSRYLPAIQEILSEIANCAVNNLDQNGYYPNNSFGSRTWAAGLEVPVLPFGELPEKDDICDAQNEPILPRHETKARKAQLLALLQAVDDQYSRSLDELHMVVSAFHAATELDPQLHARFALQTISSLYKRLRQKISEQILAVGADSCTDKTEKDDFFEASSIQKHWDLQQLKRNSNTLWRTHKGLPERSVSVLRSWMFQNFLHPYPREAEKHILALRSGLTRSQVSNWFINARVRVWKPLVEEMCSELSLIKGARLKNSGAGGSSSTNQIATWTQRLRSDDREERGENISSRWT